MDYNQNISFKNTKNKEDMFFSPSRVKRNFDIYEKNTSQIPLLHSSIKLGSNRLN
jgi:hypothetical protein